MFTLLLWSGERGSCPESQGQFAGEPLLGDSKVPERTQGWQFKICPSHPESCACTVPSLTWDPDLASVSSLRCWDWAEPRFLGFLAWRL